MFHRGIEPWITSFRYGPDLYDLKHLKSPYSNLSCDSEPDSHVILYLPLENGPSSIIGIHVANGQCKHFVGLSHGVNGVTVHVPESLQIGAVSVWGCKQGLHQWFIRSLFDCRQIVLSFLLSTLYSCSLFPCRPSEFVPYFITDKVWMFSILLLTNCSFLFYSRHACSVFVLFHCRHSVVVLYFIVDKL